MKSARFCAAIDCQINQINQSILQVCDHPYLLPGVDPMETDERLVAASSKLLLLDRLLVRLRVAGRRALVYSQFTSMLDVLADYLAFRGHRCFSSTALLSPSPSSLGLAVLLCLVQRSQVVCAVRWVCADSCDSTAQQRLHEGGVCPLCPSSLICVSLLKALTRENGLWVTLVCFGCRYEIACFENQRSPFFVYLISTRAGGLGITLVAADTVAFRIFDLYFSCSVRCSSVALFMLHLFSCRHLLL